MYTGEIMYNIDKGMQGYQGSSPRLLFSGPMILDLNSHYIRLYDRVVHIPTCAFDFLVTLARHYPEPVSYKTLVLESRNHPLTQLEAQDLARLNVYLLRRALEEDIQKPRLILTVAGYGYRLSY